MFGRDTALGQCDDVNRGVPHRSEARLDPEIVRIIHKQAFEISFRLGQHWVVLGVSERVQGDKRIQHCRKNRGQPIAALSDPLDYPALCLLERTFAKWFPGDAMKHLQRIIRAQK